MSTGYVAFYTNTLPSDIKGYLFGTAPSAVGLLHSQDIRIVRSSAIT